jgi:serine/threonine protein kinase
MIGRTLSHYEVLEKIGEGGMGEVYLAKDTKLDREVAIKVLPAAFSENKERLARFEREAQLLASLNHPNVGAMPPPTKDYLCQAQPGLRAPLIGKTQSGGSVNNGERGPGPLPVTVPSPEPGGFRLQITRIRTTSI